MRSFDQLPSNNFEVIHAQGRIHDFETTVRANHDLFRLKKHFYFQEKRKPPNRGMHSKSESIAERAKVNSMKHFMQSINNKKQITSINWARQIKQRRQLP